MALTPPPQTFLIDVDEKGALTVKFNNDSELTKPENLGTKPMDLKGFDNLFWFDTFTVMFFRAQDGSVKGCIKRANCDYTW
jgi:hypothetical protein